MSTAAEVIIDENQVSVKLDENGTFMVTKNEVALALAELLNSVQPHYSDKVIDTYYGKIRIIDRR